MPLGMDQTSLGTFSLKTLIALITSFRRHMLAEADCSALTSLVMAGPSVSGKRSHKSSCKDSLDVY
jgi:hypothetical protein